MKTLKHILSLALVFCMVFSLTGIVYAADTAQGSNADETTDEEAGIMPLSAITMGMKPDNGTTTGNPFVTGTGGSNSYRIPALVTLSDGTLVAAADARWNTTYDGGGLDTVVSRSTDNGTNWSYTFANYLGDNGNVYNSSGSTSFIDPALAVTSNDTIYMLCDLYPYGVALNGDGGQTAPSMNVGFNAAGDLKLKKPEETGYNYYLKNGKIYDSSNQIVEGYTVDEYFNIEGENTESNLFFSDSPYQVVRTGYLYLTTSTDKGETWSAPKLLNLKTDSERVCLVAPGRGTVTSDGEIIFPCYSYSGGDASQSVSFIYSTNGTDWQRSDSLSASVGWSSESQCVELSDDTLRFFFRNNSCRICYVDATKSANGYSWGNDVETDVVVNSNTEISAIKYSSLIDGQQAILVSCPTGPRGEGSNRSGAGYRLNGKIFVGLVKNDGTMEWKYSKAVTENENPFMYSCLTEMANGSVAILYENLENSWGTGPNCYYAMAFDTYTISEIAPGASM